MEDAGKSSTATLDEPAKEAVLHPTTTSLATYPGRTQLSQPTIQHIIPQTTRASPDNIGSPSLGYVYLFMDDFILLTTPPPPHHHHQQQEVRQNFLVCLDSVIQPLEHVEVSSSYL